MAIKIHQYSTGIFYGDSTTKGVFLIQKILNEFGIESNIYTPQKKVDTNLEKEHFHISKYCEDENNILLYHHSYKNKDHSNIMKLRDKKILIYHNITPSHFFDGLSFKNASNEGREQLSNSKNNFIYSIADSQYNLNELNYYNYKNSFVLPLLVDSTIKETFKLNKNIVKEYSKSFNIIFVGRIIQNKCQHQLIELMYELKLRKIDNIKLFIIGKNHYTDYFNYLFEYSYNLGLKNNVIITDSVNNDDLSSYYSISNLYLSLSEHEGFGMPLIESINYSIPVLAYDSGAISTTLGKLGLLKNKASSEVANEVIKVMKDKYYKNNLIVKQKENLKNLKYTSLKNRLKKFLNHIDVI